MIFSLNLKKRKTIKCGVKMFFSFKREVKKIIKEYLSNSKKTNQKKYKQIKNNNIKGFINVDTSFKKCPDNYIGYVSIKESNLFALADLRYVNRTKINDFNTSELQRIAIILESPHKLEFRSQLTAPALGATGKQIHLYLWKILYNASLLTEENQSVYLVNAIQYQCSLGVDTSVYRDIIFNAIWERKKKDLLLRIEKINPSIIIVASTKSFNERIINCIKDLKKYRIWQADSHPSVWNDNTLLHKVE